MTKEQIAELRRLEGDAFAPPWALNRGANGEVLSIDSVRGEPPGTQYVFGPVDEPPLFDSDSAEFVVVARNILGRLLDEREALLEALKASQWRGEAGFWEESGCPICRSSQRSGGHEAGCALSAALAKAEAE